MTEEYLQRLCGGHSDPEVRHVVTRDLQGRRFGLLGANMS